MTVTTPTEQIVPTGTWQADVLHSSLEFAVRYMGISLFRGTAGRFEGSLVSGPEGILLAGSAPVAGIATGEEILDAHLRSPEFFDAERHPEISFASNSVELRDGGDISIRGELTIKGISRQVELAGRLIAPVVDPRGAERIGLEVSTTIDRTEFGMDWNAQMGDGAASLANDVELTGQLQFVGQDGV